MHKKTNIPSYLILKNIYIFGHFKAIVVVLCSVLALPARKLGLLNTGSNCTCSDPANVPRREVKVPAAILCCHPMTSIHRFLRGVSTLFVSVKMTVCISKCKGVYASPCLWRATCRKYTSTGKKTWCCLDRARREATALLL